MTAAHPYLNRPLRSELAALSDMHKCRFRFVALFRTHCSTDQWQEHRFLARDRADAIQQAQSHARIHWKGSPWEFEGMPDAPEAVEFDDGRAMLPIEFEEWRRQKAGRDVDVMIGGA